MRLGILALQTCKVKSSELLNHINRFMLNAFAETFESQCWATLKYMRDQLLKKNYFVILALNLFALDFYVRLL